jgi:RNA polymerase sigma factor (sigma-70 family)
MSSVPDLVPADFPFERLVHALRRRDEAAWAQVFDELLPRARAAIRQEFGTTVARSENAGGQALASACGTVYRQITAGRFRLGSWDDLAGLFIRIAMNKCVDRLRAERRQVPWADLPPPGTGYSSHLDPPARDPLPEDEVMRAEAYQEFRRVVDLVRRRLKRVDDKYAEIFKLRLEGDHSVAQIAAAVGCSERTVNRGWAYAVDLMRGMLDGSVGEDLTR